MTHKVLITLCLSLACGGCATVRDHRILVQPKDQLLTASVGSTLFHLTKKGDLPNVLGGRDIYGGKVDKGYSEVKLLAIHDGTTVDLLVFDVTKESSETALDRYATRTRVNVTQNVSMGTGLGGIPVSVDTRVESEYVLSGIRIAFVKVRPTSVDYVLTDTQQKDSRQPNQASHRTATRSAHGVR